jgi:hypothetical protein
MPYYSLVVFRKEVKEGMGTDVFVFLSDALVCMHEGLGPAWS